MRALIMLTWIALASACGDRGDHALDGPDAGDGELDARSGTQDAGGDAATGGDAIEPEPEPGDAAPHLDAAPETASCTTTDKTIEGGLVNGRIQHRGLAFAHDGGRQFAFFAHYNKDLGYGRSVPPSENWQTRLIYEGGAPDVGQGARLVLDGGDRPHIIYRHQTGSIGYATRASDVAPWVLTELVVDAPSEFRVVACGEGHIHVMYTELNATGERRLMEAIRAADGTWAMQPFAEGNLSLRDLVISASHERAAIAYDVATGGLTLYTHAEGGALVPRPLATGSSAASLAFDTLGQLRIARYVSGTRTLTVDTRATDGTWRSAAVTSSAGPPSAAADRWGNVYIAYHNTLSFDVELATVAANDALTIADVETMSSNLAADVALAVAPDDSLYVIVYADAYGDAPQTYAYRLARTCI